MIINPYAYAAFSPTDIASLILWYGADRENYTDAGATTACTAGQFPYTVKNAEGTTLNLVQPTASRQVIRSYDTDWFWRFGGNAYGYTFLSAAYNAAFDFDTGDPFTMEFMIRPCFGTENYDIPCIIDNANYGVNSKGYSIRFTKVSGTYRLQIRLGVIGGDEVNVYTTTAFSNSSYYHVVITYSGSGTASGVAVKINNVADTLNTTTDNMVSGMANGSKALYIGVTSNEALNCPMRLRFVRMYDAVLSAGEITSLYDYSSSAQASAPSQNITTSALPFILSTDYGEDVGDKESLALVSRLHQQGLIDLLAVVTDTSTDSSTGAVRGSLDAYGLTAVLVGADKNASMSVSDGYATTVRNAYGLSTVRADYSNASAAMREALASASANSVVIVMIGFGDAIAELLASAADGFSSLNGVDLVAAKCLSLYWAAGDYPTGSEYNFTTSPSAANYVVTNWPTSVPIVFTGYTAGSTPVSGSQSQRFLRPLDQLYGHTGRESWDNQAVLAAVAPYLYSDQGTDGTNTVNASTGANSWASTPHVGHTYRAKLSADDVDATINRYLLANASETP